MAVLLKGLFKGFVRLHICDAVWARLTCVFCAVHIHCFWRVC